MEEPGQKSNTGNILRVALKAKKAHGKQFEDQFPKLSALLTGVGEISISSTLEEVGIKTKSRKGVLAIYTGRLIDSIRVFFTK